MALRCPRVNFDSPFRAPTEKLGTGPSSYRSGHKKNVVKAVHRVQMDLIDRVMDEWDGEELPCTFMLSHHMSAKTVHMSSGNGGEVGAEESYTADIPGIYISIFAHIMLRVVAVCICIPSF